MSNKIIEVQKELIRRIERAKDELRIARYQQSHLKPHHPNNKLMLIKYENLHLGELNAYKKSFELMNNLKGA